MKRRLLIFKTAWAKSMLNVDGERFKGISLAIFDYMATNKKPKNLDSEAMKAFNEIKADIDSEEYKRMYRREYQREWRTGFAREKECLEAMRRAIEEYKKQRG